MAKTESYSSRAAMMKHEKGEPAKMRAMEKKMGIKDVVKGSSKKKATVKKMGKKK
jgi:hypothetical protein